MKKEQKPTFLDDVFPAEQDKIKERRRQQGLDENEIEGRPHARKGLVGLAISGGGIRSASFALGVIQGLSKHGLLKHVDYMSTVSGGGYTGSCISALLNDPKNGPGRNEFPLRYTTESSEPPALTHLRNCSNYLSPGGLLSMLRLPNLLLRGVLLNIFVFLPFILFAVFLTEIAYEWGPHWDLLPALVPFMMGLFVLMALAFPFLMRILRRMFNWNRRNAYELWLTVPLLLAGIVIVAIPLLRLTRLAIEHDFHQFHYWITNQPPERVWKWAIVVAAIVILFMLVGKASENAGRIAGKVVLWIVGLMGPAVIYLIFLGICLWQIQSPFLPVESAAALNDATRCETPCLEAGRDERTAAERRADKGARNLPTDDSDQSLLEMLWHGEDGPSTPAELANAFRARGLSFGPTAVISCQTEGGCPDTLDTGIYPAWQADPRVWVVNDDPQGMRSDSVNPCPAFERYDEGRLDADPNNCFYLNRVSLNSLRITGPAYHQFPTREDLWYVVIFALLWLFNRFLLNINITSPHGFYRDRLSKAFLFRVDENGHTVPEDNLKLSELNAPGTSGPYHLINVALNLQGSHAQDLRGRECDFFTFTRDFCGGERTGWSPTEDMERHDHHLDLATAMAISGAAAAPNMGVSTNRALIFIMTLLNIRLGYWLPNPKRVNVDSWLTLSTARPSLIWKEALGRLDENGSHVNVSDGGHIENLAIYQLLKRQCKLIVAIDGECDPGMNFGGLATLMRFARIDLGVEIAIDLDDLRKGADGLSANHWCLGEIRYPNGGTGQLLYVKLSVTGDEPEYVRAYREKRPDFPHQPTSDQFFSEAQFEAYRALGEHACEGMLSDVHKLGGFAALTDLPRSQDPGG